jgi:HTH-type transcriptional regulator, quorum sensing regulator NprR
VNLTKNIGRIIKMERINQGIKQIQLAKGICSVSYLSKIENGTVEASADVIQLLLKRLQLNINDLKSNFEHSSVFLDTLMEWYKNITITRNKKKAIEYFTRLQSESSKIKLPSAIILFRLFCMRYYLLLSEIEKIPEIIEKLNFFKDDFSSKEQYYYHKFMGLYYYLLGNFPESLIFFTKAKDFFNYYVTDDWEKSDTLYMYALSAIKLEQTLSCIHAAQEALDLFTKNINYTRSADCYILLGICYKKLGETEKALQSFYSAQQIVEQLNINELKGTILQNLGSLYAKIGETKKALQYYHRSLKHKEGVNEKLITIFSIVKEYSKSKNIDSLKKYIQKGLDLINGLEDTYKEYYFHFHIYKTMHEQKDEHFEELLKSAIQYFEDIGDHRHAYKYSTLLSTYYFDTWKYKLSSIYMQKANQLLLKKENINFWEDI